jgi:hypothetical protein
MYIYIYRVQDGCLEHYTSRNSLSVFRAPSFIRLVKSMDDFELDLKGRSKKMHR